MLNMYFYFRFIKLPNSLEHSRRKRAKGKLERILEIFAVSFFALCLIARKPLEILEPIIALEAVCIKKKVI